MLTILEGPDCSGKTTLLKQFPYQNHEHFGPPSQNGAWADYTAELNKQWRVRSMMDTVYDRFVFGELIYGPLLRPTAPAFTRAHVRMLERVMLSMQGVLVGCISDWETTEKLWLERKNKGQELITDTSKFHKSWLEWDRLLVNQIETDGHLPTLFYDWRETTTKQLLTRIAEVRPPKNIGPGVGMWKEGVTLLVGDRVNPLVMENKDWPFVASSGSSFWLAQQLETIYYPEDRLYWVNANGLEGQSLDPKFLDELKPDYIYALGEQAAIWAKKHQLAHRKIQHPVYWRRFMTDDPYPLLQYLLDDVAWGNEEQGQLGLGAK